MKILIINTLYYPNMVGGAERSVQILAESLVIKGHDVIVLSISNKQGIQSKVINGVKAYYIGLKNIYYPFQERKNEIFRLCWHLIDIYNPLMAHQVSKIIRLECPDIIHTNNLSGFSVSIWSVAIKYQIPVIHTLRDYYLPCYLTTMHKKGKNCFNQCLPCRFFGFIKKHYSRLPDTVVGISKYILDRHIDLGFFKNVKSKEVIFNSCYHSSTVVLKNSKKFKFGFLGRIAKQKGLELLLDSFNKLKNNDVQLYIGGKGEEEYYKYIQNKYFNIKNIKFWGYVNPETFLKELDILVVPSLWSEPFGRTIVEAYQFGIPVIGSIRGGISDLIIPGETGFLFDPDKSGDLFSIMANIVQNSSMLQGMSIKCRDKSTQFHPDVISDLYLHEYFRMF